MDRDVAIQITDILDNIKTGLQQLSTNTIPSDDNRSVSPAPAEDQRSAPEADPEEPEAPAEEPKTRTKK